MLQLLTHISFWSLALIVHFFRILKFKKIRIIITEMARMMKGSRGKVNTEHFTRVMETFGHY